MLDIVVLIGIGGIIVLRVFGIKAVCGAADLSSIIKKFFPSLEP